MHNHSLASVHSSPPEVLGTHTHTYTYILASEKAVELPGPVWVTAKYNIKCYATAFNFISFFFIRMFHKHSFSFQFSFGQLCVDVYFHPLRLCEYLELVHWTNQHVALIQNAPKAAWWKPSCCFMFRPFRKAFLVEHFDKDHFSSKWSEAEMQTTKSGQAYVLITKQVSLLHTYTLAFFFPGVILSCQELDWILLKSRYWISCCSPKLFKIFKI